MKHYGKLAAALAMLVAAPIFSHAGERAVITKDALVEMFDGMATNSSWDLAGPLLWGFYFTDLSREKLERAAPLLEARGYRLVDIYQSDEEASDEPDLWWLHVERIERHTVDTLHQRNQVLYQFADEQDLGSYDGMDVGPVADTH